MVVSSIAMAIWRYLPSISSPGAESDVQTVWLQPEKEQLGVITARGESSLLGQVMDHVVVPFFVCIYVHIYIYRYIYIYI